jgi:hypothetical protein
MSQLSTTGTLCKGMPTSTSNLNVLSHIRSRHERMSNTISKDLGKEEPEQLKCPVDLYRING